MNNQQQFLSGLSANQFGNEKTVLRTVSSLLKEAKATVDEIESTKEIVSSLNSYRQEAKRRQMQEKLRYLRLRLEQLKNMKLISYLNLNKNMQMVAYKHYFEGKTWEVATSDFWESKSDNLVKNEIDRVKKIILEAVKQCTCVL